MPTKDLLVLSGVVAIVAVVLRFFLWRAIACVRPGSYAFEADAPGDSMQVPTTLEGLVTALRALGFEPLGSHTEKAVLGPRRENFNYVNAGAGTFATVYADKRGGPHLYLFTPTEGGGFVITSNHRRPAREVPGRYLSGTLEDHPPDRLFKAHQRRIANVGAPSGPWTLEGRVDAARAWLAGPGPLEIRLQNSLGSLWVAG